MKSLIFISKIIYNNRFTCKKYSASEVQRPLKRNVVSAVERVFTPVPPAGGFGQVHPS